MSSSSSQDDVRRLQRATGARQLTRRNSSFLNSVKNYVPKPLARFFSGSEEFDDSKDEMGKRRRLDGQQNEPVDGHDDGPAPPKRLRLRSPDRAASQPPPHTASGQSGYLDPPSSAFQSFFQPSYLSNDPSNRSSSLTLPATTTSDIPRNEPRTTLSPLRNQFSRTMSIDPPQNPITRRLSRDVTMKSVVLPPLHDAAAARDMSMEPASGSFLRSSVSKPRDTSLPLGFRIRTSVTPQPVRDSSEPPTISSLGSKPVFVRGPAPEASKPQATLGSLVDTQRRTQSPVRQHSSSSLLFGSQSTSVKAPRPATVAERTLHELDVYRTPLKPSRLRENSTLTLSPGDATDMFSRKKSYQRMPGGRTAKAKVANHTKPYAGDAGIKKHLARSRNASVEEAASSKGELNGDVSMNEDRPLSETLPEINKDREELKSPDCQSKTSKATEKQSTMPSSSSLRVGRTFTSRNHIDRPSRPGKHGFSAVYDDAEEERREEESKKEREMMEEAAKHVPMFNIPAGFSFAKDTDKSPDVASDSSKAKEPPIPSLPFSISSFQSSTPSVLSAASSNGSKADSTTVSPFTSPAPPGPAPVPDILPKVDSVSAISSTAETLPKTNGGIPDFFATSKTLAPTPLVVPPMTLTAAAASAPTSLPFSLTPQQPPAATPAPSAPVHDADNTLWNGGKKDDIVGKPPAPSSDTKGAGTAFTFSGPGSTTPFASFGSAKLDDGLQTSTPAATPAESSFKPPSFSFANGATPESSGVAESTLAPPLFSIEPAKTAEPEQVLKPSPLTFGSNNATKENADSNAFSFDQTSNNSEPKTNGFFGKQTQAVDLAPKPSTATTFAFGSTPAPAAPSTPAISFGDTSSSKPAMTSQLPFSLGSAPGASNNNTAFTFGAPNAPADKAEPTPKPPFSFGPVTTVKDSGTATPISFAFGSSSSDKKNEPSSSSMFGFGATPSTPPISDADKKPSFSFNQTPTSAPATSFSFGGGSASGDSSKSFSFGAAATNTRPVTPPNQDQEIKMDESPTRDMQVTSAPKIAEPRPTLGVFPSFNNTSGASSFGQSGGSMTPTFTFGATTTTSNPFAKENKPEENKGFGGFGQSSGSSSGFPFTRKVSEEPPRPSTAGAFSFQSPNSATGSGSGFGFGGASNGSTTTFPSGPLSAPNSPSTFNTPSPSFTFAAAPTTTNPFAFGSQPASPATGSTNLPSVPSTGFGGSGFGGSSNPFGATSTSPAVPSSGGTLFTIGAAPSAPPSGVRQIKKLPNRRGAKR